MDIGLKELLNLGLSPIDIILLYVIWMQHQQNNEKEMFIRNLIMKESDK